MDASALSPEEKATVCHQYDRVCKLALKGVVIDYRRYLDNRQKHEILFSEMPELKINELSTVDEYKCELYNFQVLGYAIEVKDVLLAEALLHLTEKKRNVVLLAYFLGMTDTEIAREMHLVSNTIKEHRKRSLELLRQKMKGTDEKN